MLAGFGLGTVAVQGLHAQANVPVYDGAAFAEFRDELIGLPLSHLWRGHGSAIFLKFGG